MSYTRRCIFVLLLALQLANCQIDSLAEMCSTFCSVRQQDFLWISDPTSGHYNCDGTVTDAVCCNDNVCSSAQSSGQCTGPGKRSLLCKWLPSINKCVAFRDTANNVCCQKDGKPGCKEMAKGICPDDWQVPEGCCSDLGCKWNNTLLGIKPGHVCCNAPCRELENHRCHLKAKCAPQQRSLYFQNPLYSVGFDKLAQNPYLAQEHSQIGKIYHDTGFGGDYGLTILDEYGQNNHVQKQERADEITVDDLMGMLIDAFQDDKDVIQYNAEATADPYLGKTLSGGHIARFNNPNPNIFLDRIYGSPFGLSQGLVGNFPHISHNPYGYPSYPYQQYNQPPSYQPYSYYNQGGQYYGQQQSYYPQRQQQQSGYGYQASSYE